MGDLVLPLEVLVAVLFVLVLLLAAFVGRRRFLSRDSGSFECSLRRSQVTGKGWTLGLARYESDRIEWFRVFDLSMRPRRVLRRADLQVTGRRYPSGAEAFSVTSGSVIVRCTDASGPIELAMSEQSYTGFASWLEAAPPGQHVAVS